MLDTLGRHLVLILFDLQTLCENSNFSFLHEILNYSLCYVLWAAGLLWQFALRRVLMKITLEVRVLSLFFFCTLGPCSPMRGLMHIHNLLMNILHLIHNQTTVRNQLFSIKEMKCTSGTNVWEISRNVRNSSNQWKHTLACKWTHKCTCMYMYTYRRRCTHTHSIQCCLWASSVVRTLQALTQW